MMIAACVAALSASLDAASPASGYAGQESRDVKALSQEEIQGLLAGNGMGFAKAAELNGYPGPLHVLELASELRLSDAQRKQTEALYAKMKAQAVALGSQLVEEERRLDHLFADRSVTSASLADALARIGALQAKVRGAHLDAHLAQAQLLSAEQRDAYMRLRGYSTGQGHDHRQHQPAHQH
jgi:hypothetical protein